MAVMPAVAAASQDQGFLPARHDFTRRRSLTVAAVGDVLTEGPVLAAARSAAAGTDRRYVFDTLLGQISPVIRSANLAICHMEVPIGNPGARVGEFGRSAFGGNLILAPHEIAGGLGKAGFDRCSTASNHSNDLGREGIDSTLSAFDDAGIGHAGTARTPDEAVDRVFFKGGIGIAHLSYTRYSNTSAPGDPWRLYFPRSAQAVIDDVVRVRQAGAEIVIISVHVSRELLRGPIEADRAFIEAITATADVDLVIQHGPHVVQPVEQVNGTWVYWSVGNFLSGMGQPGALRYGPPTLDGLLAWVRFTESTPGDFVATPSNVLICNEIVSRVVLPVVSTLADPTLDIDLRRQLEGCLYRSASLVPDLI